MKFLVLADDKSFDELVSLTSEVNWQRINDINIFGSAVDTDACFNLMDDASEFDYSQVQKPVFINSVIHSLNEKSHPSNVVRINGWKGFIERPIWEVSGEFNEFHQQVMSTLNRKYIKLNDEAGFISPRVIAMIINEAYYAKAENVSTEKEIDIAMKLGTNYPKGPFEWSEQIGINNIYALLKVLGKTDPRYQPCSLLEAEALKP